MAGATTQQLISFKLGGINGAARGHERALGDRGSRWARQRRLERHLKQSMRQVLCMACGCSPTRSERACLGTLVSTAYGPPARPSVLQKSVSMSVFYGCVWVALFAARVGEHG